MIFEGSNLSEASHLPHNSKNDTPTLLESRNLGMDNIKKNVLAVSYKHCYLIYIFKYYDV